MLWLALHFPHLPLEIFSAAQTDARQALIVLERNRVLLTNLVARDHGIEAGTTLATAHSICPKLVHQHRDTHAEATRLHELANTLYRFSGHVSIQAPDCVLLEISGSLALFGCHQDIMRDAVRLCEALGHKATARTATTPWAAIALARDQKHHLEEVALKNAGLELANIADNIVERFANMGIYTLGPLLELPSKALGKRFGKAILKYLKQLTGEVPDPRKAITPAPGFSQSRHLLSPILNKDNLHTQTNSPMPQLAYELQHWLISHQLGCEALQWQFLSHQRSDGANKLPPLSVRFATAKQSAADFLRISQLKLEQSELPKEVLTVTLAAKRLRPWMTNSQDLFKTLPQLNKKNPLESEHTSMGEIIDELTARLGDGTCQGIQTRTQHAPEHAWHTVPAHQLPYQPKQSQANAQHDFLKQLSQRPLWLFNPPRRVHRSELQIIQGPERIKSQWWSQQTACRDYYIAQHSLGAECWVFVNTPDHACNEGSQTDNSQAFGLSNEWFLHGYFG